MPIYEITTSGEEKKRLVKAESGAQAVRHCAKGMFTTRTVTKAEDIADLISAGVALETAGKETAEPEVEQEQEQEQDGEKVVDDEHPPETEEPPVIPGGRKPKAD